MPLKAITYKVKFDNSEIKSSDITTINRLVKERGLRPNSIQLIIGNTIFIVDYVSGQMTLKREREEKIIYETKVKNLGYKNYRETTCRFSVGVKNSQKIVAYDYLIGWSFNKEGKENRELLKISDSEDNNDILFQVIKEIDT